MNGLEDSELEKLKAQIDQGIKAHNEVHLKTVKFIESCVYETFPYLFELIKYNLNQLIEVKQDIIKLLELKKDA